MNVPEENDILGMNTQLREANQQARLQLIQSHFTFASTLCQTAEIELGYGQIDVARRLTDKIHAAYESLRYRLVEPHHVPEYSLDGFLKQLGQLEERMLRLESQLGV